MALTGTVKTPPGIGEIAGGRPVVEARLEDRELESRRPTTQAQGTVLDDLALRMSRLRMSRKSLGQDYANSRPKVQAWTSRIQ
jgi:hypothetical protein